jgi:hypothetical protein
MIEVMPAAMLVCAGGTVLLLLADVASRRVSVGCGVALASAVVGVSGYEARWTVGAVSVLPYDVVPALLLVAIGLKLLRRPDRLARLPVPLVVLAALFVVGLARGVAAIGWGGDLDFRDHLNLVTSALYVVLVGRDDRHAQRDLLRAWIAAGAAVAVLACGRWSALAAGIGAGSRWDVTSFGISRVVPASGGLIVAQAALILLARRSAGRRGASGKAIVALLLVAVSLEHRTVWAVLLAGALLLVARRRRPAHLLVLGGVAVLAVVVLALSGGSAGGGVAGTRSGQVGVVSSFGDAATNAESWDWRTKRWGEVLDEHLARGPGAIVVGAGYGVPWLDVVTTSHVVGPHNFALELLVRMGIVGLAATALLYVRALRRCGLGADDLATWILVATQLVFYLTYSPAPEQGLLLGLGLLVAARRRSGSRRVEAARS